MAKNKLSIYLIKKEIEEEKIFDKEKNNVEVLKKHDENKISYFIPSYVHPPTWLKSFFEMENDRLKQANSRVVLLDKLNIDGDERTFAVVFGYAKNLFAEDVLEEQFGLKIVLNIVDINSIRKISKISVGGNQKQSQEQMPKTSNINEFGFDLDRDLIRNVTAKCNDEYFEKANITGGDIFSLLAEVDIDNIDDFLIKCYKKYKEEKYKDNFEWIDNIKEVKAKSDRVKLDETLMNYIVEQKWDSVWMSVPEIILWEGIKGFKYLNDDEIEDDISIEKFIESFRNDLYDISQIKRRKIYMYDINDEVANSWGAYKCINAEIEINENMYCLNNGKWYCINKDFSEKIEKEYQVMHLSNIQFIDYNESMKTEDDYNEQLSNNLENSYLIHKIGEIPFGGGTGNKIEVCDVMTANNELIHIKKNGGSAQLSHLFNQATVSAELLLDKAFRKSVNNKMKQCKFDRVLPDNYKSSDYTIVIGIINKYHEERPKIPFFSKVALRYTIKRITNFGYKVEIKNIKKI